ncbi:MAG TPA: 3'-5' exonuclease, partial [Gemmataceae bacterium]
EEGLLPHDRSAGKPDEIEEERRLAFVGMTRAKEELYLCHARMRDFRGNTYSTRPSSFFNELPKEAIEVVDQSDGSSSALDHWRGGGGAAAAQGWIDVGLRPKSSPIPPRAPEGDGVFVAGMLVRHAAYGNGRIVEVSGHGALRRVKVRFATAGERSFIADHVKLEIVRKS